VGKVTRHVTPTYCYIVYTQLNTTFVIIIICNQW